MAFRPRASCPDEFFFIHPNTQSQPTPLQKKAHSLVSKRVDSIMSLPGTPIDSETFLPPAACKHKSGDDAFLQAQNADRERTVCAVGLDVHYELNVVANESGAHKPRLKPFNPRMSGPACPYNYTGKFVKEDVHVKNRSDPIELGRLVAKETAYDPGLYATKDPRLVSKTVVVRDYGCKIPIDVADTEKIARAVLNHYPDQYVAFLGEFVSNLFGANMRKFLETQMAGYQKLLDVEDELNRVSWGSYISVQGGSASAAKSDCTLPWTSGLDEFKKNAVGMTGQSNIAKVSCADLYDLRPCLKQHVETLRMMRSEWCRGFGAKEEHVLAMLCYANEQGRNLCADLRLMGDSDAPDYEQVRLHTPVNFYNVSDAFTDTIDEPDRNASVRARLVEAQRGVGVTGSMRYPVGNWSGSADTANVFLNTANGAPYQWGWGHPGNLAVRCTNLTAAPYLRYKVNGTTVTLNDETPGVAYVDKSKWGDSLRDQDDARSVLPKAEKREAASLRDQLRGGEDAPFRSSEDAPFRAAQAWTQMPPASNASAPSTVPRSFLETTSASACDSTKGLRFSVLNPKLVKGCESLDPFVRFGSGCFDASGPCVTFPARILSLYHVDDLVSSPIFLKLIGADATAGDAAKITLTAALTSNTSSANPGLAKVKQVFKDVYGGAWPYHLLTMVRRFRKHSGNALQNTPFETSTADFNAYKDRKSITHQYDFSGLKFDVPRLTVDLADLGGSPSDKIALQIYLLRKSLQYSMGMDVAFAICAEPIFTRFKESLLGAVEDDVKQATFRYYQQLWKTRRCEGTWVANEDETEWTLQDDAGKDIPQPRVTEILLKCALDEMLRRVKAFINKDATKMREIASNAGGLLRSEGLTYAGFNSDTTDLDVPTEWLFQKEQNISTQDPRMLFAETKRSYQKQYDEFKFLESSKWDPRATTMLTDPLGYPLMREDRMEDSGTPFTPLVPVVKYVRMDMLLDDKTERDAVRKQVDAWTDHLTKKFHEGMAIHGVPQLLNDFLTLDREYKGAAYRGPFAMQTSLPESGVFPMVADATNAQATGVTEADSEPIKHSDDLSQLSGGGKRLLLLPMGGDDDTSVFTSGVNSDLKYNVNLSRTQLFPMLDAAALLWNARAFFNPADANRPKADEHGNQDDMHYWCRVYVESFLSARELYKQKYGGTQSTLWERDVKTKPLDAFPSKLIGAMCDDTFKRLFPLLPNNHKLRDDLRRVRSLSVMWGTLPSYSAGGSPQSGAWMPLSAAQRVRLLDSVGLFDRQYQVPVNPWLAHNGQGISRVYNQSYHSVYHTDSWRAPHFREWVKHACRYQPPRAGGDSCFYPFSHYGGTPVEGDFVPHRVERPHTKAVEARHSQLVYNRFGFTKPLRIGQQFNDTGLLQDLFQFEYRPFANLSLEQRALPAAAAVYPSNFMAYARTHAIVALASCNQGTEEASVPRIVRNLYRLYVDTYQCMGANPDDDGVPVVMGFLPHTVHRKEDRPVVLYAGSLACLNAKLEAFCASGANRGERVCQIYKQVYLNDATLLFTRLLRAERRKTLHDANFSRAQFKRGPDYTRERFDGDLINLQDAYIDFLQTTVLGMLLESGANLQGAPLHLLEPRELEVSQTEEDTDVVGNDFLTPATQELVKGMDFGGDTLNRTQMAILSLIPPNNRILGTLRLNQSTQIVDMEHIKKQIQKETIEGNKKVWDKYLEALVSGSFAAKYLETNGPVDFGFDLSAIKDPLKESEGIKTKFTTSNRQQTSSLSQSVRGDLLRQERGPDSVLGMNSAEMKRALQLVRDRVERDYRKFGGHTARVKCLAMLKIPDHVKRMLRPEYE